MKKIILSVLFISIPVWGIWLWWHFWHEAKQSNPVYDIHYIIQTGPQKEALKTLFLAELLDLSCDNPTNLYRFSVEEAEKKLLSCPVIKKACIKKVFPDTLYIDYTVRNPIALVYEYPNTGIDEEGIIFPISPYFTPKRLPEIYMGLPVYGETEKWGQALSCKEGQLALELLKYLSVGSYKEAFRLLRVDVAAAYAESLGRRQIVLIVEDETTPYLFPRILRLTPRLYSHELDQYLKLRGELMAEERAKYEELMRYPPAIVDLRLDGVAYVRH